MRKIFKILIVLVCVIAGLFFWFDQSRSFFKATNGKYITMWKRYGGTCYLIHGKYYGITKPNDNYIETKNTASVDFIWNDKNSKYVLFLGGENCKIVNNDPTKVKIINYLEEKQKNDSLYIKKQGHYNIYKKGVIRLGINILEGYASDGMGETQR
ncbi:hypothetical protein MKJ01_17530 [Chryseobacterium sp. SSA4.19]|uniref:hypothetical protein n=1 Tax=Chryseobacterium sp. SSA4.19 TaxID=2919915 RepID=UPI001F4EE4BA|nr:hypothetical protein [Chryseobacterium sp. SSA4.19]MCJ8155561.1 hypothetical protein [Chryseobacterium sp. SSA4.19]